MKDILDRNLSVLKEYQPRLYKKIILYIEGKLNSKINCIQNILLAKSDEVIVNMAIRINDKDYLICDHENPIEEAYSWIDNYINITNNVDIIFGLGFGYHIDVIINSFKGKKIIIVEPSLEIFYQLIKIRNYENIFKNTKIFLEEPIENFLVELNTLFWNTKISDLQCEPFYVYAEMFYEIWDDLRTKFIRFSEDFTSDVITRKHFAKKWAKNYITNLRKISFASDASSLISQFVGIPGILISAGPSLYKNIDLIKNLNNKCVIMAAGTAVLKCIQKEVIPHFMVGIDANPSEANIHKKVDEDIFFIYSNQVAIGSIENFKGNKFLMNYSEDYYTKMFLEKNSIKSEIYLSGPSVANTCIDILYKMGCNPIVLVGQDLAFTDGIKYAGGKKWVDSNSEKIEDNDYILRKDIFNKDIYTNPQFINMKNWFDNYFDRFCEKRIFLNSTEGGLGFNSIPNVDLKDVIDKFFIEEYPIKNIISKVYRENSFNNYSDEKIRIFEEHLLTEIKKMEELSNKLENNLDMIDKDFYHPKKSRKKFNEVVSNISKFDDEILNSILYKPFLKNLLSSDFYVLKSLLEEQVENLNEYDDIKNNYIKVLNLKLELVRNALKYLQEIFQLDREIMLK